MGKLRLREVKLFTWSQLPAGHQTSPWSCTGWAQEGYYVNLELCYIKPILFPFHFNLVRFREDCEQVQESQSWTKIMRVSICPLAIRFFIFFIVSLSPHGSQNHLAWISRSGPCYPLDDLSHYFLQWDGPRAQVARITFPWPRLGETKNIKEWEEGKRMGKERQLLS